MLRTEIPADPAIHALAMRLAQECRRIVQACLREEEWRDADLEFYQVIRLGLEHYRPVGNASLAGTSQGPVTTNQTMVQCSSVIVSDEKAGRDRRELVVRAAGCQAEAVLKHDIDGGAA